METTVQAFENPYRPGAGQMPPHLAGRQKEYDEFDRLLRQQTILDNLVLTGLRGVGKTVLLETFKPRAQRQGWLWVGTDLSESASVSETNLAIRLLADLAVVTSGISIEARTSPGVGFGPAPEPTDVALTYQVLERVFQQTPGLISDRIKAVLEFVWAVVKDHDRSRVIFSYDEAQNLSDHAARDEFPLSVLLDVFQSIQRKGIPFMLVLTGLPTLFPKLVEARTFAERMFRVVMIDKLSDEESREAIIKPLEQQSCPVRLATPSVDAICRESGGYPYFIQFICREVYDVIIQDIADQGSLLPVSLEAIQRKLDTDFFAGRWAKVTDRQRQLLYTVATLGHGQDEFTIQELVEASRQLLEKPFSSSHASQMLATLGDYGIIYKNRFGKYSFAVPLLDKFILRTYELPARV
ncbi:MAG TPA: AAA family ATPase [Egibacteraceae bacterium]|nr:AAA family ATPase [Egibacteraceae bacterium]